MPTNRVGEEIEYIYVTSFKIPITQDNEFRMVNARLAVPRSEFTYYTMIADMQDKGYLTMFGHLTAEFALFSGGYRVVT
jgi:hypothetical protein